MGIVSSADRKIYWLEGMANTGIQFTGRLDVAAWNKLSSMIDRASVSANSDGIRRLTVRQNSNSMSAGVESRVNCKNVVAISSTGRTKKGFETSIPKP